MIQPLNLKTLHAVHFLRCCSHLLWSPAVKNAVCVIFVLYSKKFSSADMERSSQDKLLALRAGIVRMPAVVPMGRECVVVYILYNHSHLSSHCLAHSVLLCHYSTGPERLQHSSSSSSESHSRLSLPAVGVKIDTPNTALASDGTESRRLLKFQKSEL